MSNNVILLSIRPQYANKIFKGYKSVELRRICPKYIEKGTLVLVYVSSPIQALAGAFKVDRVIKKPLQELWEIVQDKAGITNQEFEAYYDGVSSGFGIFFTEVWKFSKPIRLDELQEHVSDFYPPQGFRYITKRELASPRIGNFVKDVKTVMQKVPLRL